MSTAVARMSRHCWGGGCALAGQESGSGHAAALSGWCFEVAYWGGSGEGGRVASAVAGVPRLCRGGSNTVSTWRHCWSGRGAVSRCALVLTERQWHGRMTKVAGVPLCCWSGVGIVGE